MCARVRGYVQIHAYTYTHICTNVSILVYMYTPYLYMPFLVHIPASIYALLQPFTNNRSFGTDMYYSQQAPPPQQQPQQTVPSASMQYPQHQAPLMHPGPPQPYSPHPYGQYHPYSNGLTSPSAASSVSNPMAGPTTVLPLPGVPGGQGQMPGQYTGFDTTGQHPPPGMKPRVTATLWEDEGSLCFQVEARGICVARREGMFGKSLPIEKAGS